MNKMAEEAKRKIEEINDKYEEERKERYEKMKKEQEFVFSDLDFNEFSRKMKNKELFVLK